MSETPIIRRLPVEPWRPALPPRRHDDAYLERFVEAALRILERTGVRVVSEQALEVFREHGASCDAESSVVRLSEEAVRGALAGAPRTFTLASRDGSCDLDLTPGTTHTTSSGCGTEVIDWRTGERRASTKADLADATRMQDYLSSIGYWWPTVSAGDHGQTAPLHELDVGFNNTVKHLQAMVQGAREARYAVAMASVVAGGGEQLRRRPVMSDLVCAVSPLVIDRDGAEAALVFAQAGVPLVLGSAPCGGTTAPATGAGLMALCLAEVLALVVLVQLACPGAPVIGYMVPGSADPRTGEPDYVSLGLRDPSLCAELVHYVGLPSQHGVGGEGSELPGTWSDAAEAASSLAWAASSGSELTVGLGLTDGGTLWAAEDFILDDQLYHQARYAVTDVAVDEEQFALGVVDAVGPGGHFLAHAHTRRHLRAGYSPGLGSEIGPGGRRRDAVDVARERARVILERYEPEPLDEDKAATLREVLAQADAEIKAGH